jgi:hypothetical protein
MFGRKKVELIDDHVDEEDLDDTPQQKSATVTAPPKGKSNTGFQTTNKTTQSIIDLQNKQAEKQQQNEKDEQAKKKGTNVVGHLFKKHIMLGKQAVLQGLGKADNLVFPEDFEYHNTIVKDAFVHYKDVAASGKRFMKSSSALSQEEATIGENFLRFAENLRTNDKDASCVDLVYKAGVAFVTLSSLRDQLHNDYASEFLHTIQTGLDEYDTCREVKQIYREGVQAENIETRKLENMKNSNDLVKLKKQEKDTEDRRIAAEELHKCIMAELDFQEKYRDKEYVDGLRKMLNSYRTYFAAGMETMRKLEHLLDNCDTLPESTRNYTLPSKDKNIQQTNTVQHTPKKKNKVFGAPLEEAVANSPYDIPSICHDMITLLTPRVETEGLFRLAGDTTAMAKLRKMYDNGRGNIDLVQNMLNTKDIDIHGVGGLLKTYIRELPTPLLTFELYDQFLNIPSLSEEDGIRSAQGLLAQIPPVNAALMNALFQLLTALVEQSEKNRMNHTNIAIVFGLNCIRSKDTNPMTMVVDSAKINKCFEFLLKWYPNHLANILSDVASRVSKSKQSDQSIAIFDTPTSSFETNRVYAPPPKRESFSTTQSTSQKPPVPPTASRRPLPPPPPVNNIYSDVNQLSSSPSSSPQPQQTSSPHLTSPSPPHRTMKVTGNNAPSQILSAVMGGSLRGRTPPPPRTNLNDAFVASPQPKSTQQTQVYSGVPVDDPFGDFENSGFGEDFTESLRPNKQKQQEDFP